MLQDIKTISDLLKYAEENKIPKEEFEKGMKVEKEHSDTVEKIKKDPDIPMGDALENIVKDHEKEFKKPEYYKYLDKMEKTMEKEVGKKQSFIGVRDIDHLIKIADEQQGTATPEQQEEAIDQAEHRLEEAYRTGETITGSHGESVKIESESQYQKMREGLEQVRAAIRQKKEQGAGTWETILGTIGSVAKWAIRIFGLLDDWVPGIGWLDDILIFVATDYLEKGLTGLGRSLDT